MLLFSSQFHTIEHHSADKSNSYKYLFLNSKISFKPQTQHQNNFAYGLPNEGLTSFGKRVKILIKLSPAIQSHRTICDWEFPCLMHW